MAFVQITEPKYKWVCDVCGKDIEVFGDMVTIKITSHKTGHINTVHAHDGCLIGKGIVNFLPSNQEVA